MSRAALVVLIIMAQNAPVLAAEGEVSAVAVRVGAGTEEIVLSAAKPIEYKHFFLDNPDRLVIDMPATGVRNDKSWMEGYNGNLLENVRLGQFNPTTARLVLDLATQVALQSVSVKNQGDGKPYLIIFTIAPLHPQVAAAAPVDPVVEPAVPVKQIPRLVVSEEWAKVAQKHQGVKLPFDVLPVPIFKPGSKPVVARKPTIVIDAGHGGQDPGAQGVSGTREKYVTLEYARALRDSLQKTGRYNVVLTRDDDRFILLRERLAIGRRAKGDVFISIHADSAPNRETRGLSLYTLSDTASDKEAEALASRENKVDLVYGLNLSQESQDVTEILIDLAQRETKNKSTRLADHIVNSLGEYVKLLPNTHRYAGFAVLKAPDVPSVLIEIGFLTNRKDEGLINGANYREKLVSGIIGGLDKYFAAQKFW